MVVLVVEVVVTAVVTASAVVVAAGSEVVVAAMAERERTGVAVRRQTRWPQRHESRVISHLPPAGYRGSRPRLDLDLRG